MIGPLNPVAVRETNRPDGVRVSEAVAVAGVTTGGDSWAPDSRAEKPNPPPRLIWPRISPPGFAAVWTLTYMLPAIRSRRWAGVSATVPVAVVPTKLAVIGIVTGPFTPIAPVWKWAAVIAPVSPVTVILNARPCLVCVNA